MLRTTELSISLPEDNKSDNALAQSLNNELTKLEGGDVELVTYAIVKDETNHVGVRFVSFLVTLRYLRELL